MFALFFLQYSRNLFKEYRTAEKITQSTEKDQVLTEVLASWYFQFAEIFVKTI